MAGSLAMTIASDRPLVATRDQRHHIHFFRFFTYTNPSRSSTCPPSFLPNSAFAGDVAPGSLLLLPTLVRKSSMIAPPPTRTSPFISARSSKSTAFPSCNSPGLRFLSSPDIQPGIQELCLPAPKIPQDTLKDKREAKSLNSDFRSETHLDLNSCRPMYFPSRTCVEELDIMASVDTYIPEMPPSLRYEVEQPCYNQETNLSYNFESIYPALPPSFTSLITNCCPKVKEDRFLVRAMDRYISSDTI